MSVPQNIGRSLTKTDRLEYSRNVRIVELDNSSQGNPNTVKAH